MGISFLIHAFLIHAFLIYTFFIYTFLIYTHIYRNATWAQNKDLVHKL
jgi:hypothetical protein